MRQRDDLRAIFLAGIPLLDVRAPVEFARGAFPGAVNIPLLEDAERKQVGTTYNRAGHDAAVALGHELVSGSQREARVERWRRFAQTHPEGALYCFRGGLRSEIVQRWLAEAGVDYPRILGGYKAMRRYLIETLDALADPRGLVLLGGRTGVGKTELLVQLPAHVDLEAHANHRGSGFGRRLGGQPGNIDFENAIAVDWLRLADAGHRRVVMEDESRCIGACALPEALWTAFGQAPIVVLEDELSARVRRIRAEYVEAALAEYREAFGDAGFERYAAGLRDSLARIRKRLGGERYQALAASMDAALERQEAAGDIAGHDHWIEALLAHYYDPMYDYQLGRKSERVVFRGTSDAVAEYLAEERPETVDVRYSGG